MRLGRFNDSYELKGLTGWTQNWGELQESCRLLRYFLKAECSILSHQSLISSPLLRIEWNILHYCIYLETQWSRVLHTIYCSYRKIYLNANMVGGPSFKVLGKVLNLLSVNTPNSLKSIQLQFPCKRSSNSTQAFQNGWSRKSVFISKVYKFLKLSMISWTKS